MDNRQKEQQPAHLIIQDGKLIVKEQPSIEVVPFAKDNFFANEKDQEYETLLNRNEWSLTKPGFNSFSCRGALNSVFGYSFQ